MRKLKLGPIVGHTDDASTRVWIQVDDNPANYSLRVDEVGLFPFEATEGDAIEFGTALARVDGLQADHKYDYRIVRRGRFVPGARGSFRTFPPQASMTNLLFCAVSCNGAETHGAWEQFSEYVKQAQPSFVLMMGDQVYLDEDPPNVYKEHLDSDSSTRRKVMAEMYQANWSREPLKSTFANVPIYMLWDDHDIRDGFGSLAQDSPTLAERYPRGRPLYDKMNAYFEDARDVFWHFQGCRNPGPQDSTDPSLPNYVGGPISPGVRKAMPYVFRCGRLVVLMIDSRGERDAFRKDLPILGTRQWAFINEVFANLPDDVEALAVVTPTPIASQDPDGQSQKLLGTRTDDVDSFRKGDEQATFHPKATGTDDAAEIAKTIVSARISSQFNVQPNWGTFQRNNLDEARDQWSHRVARREQATLIHHAVAARKSITQPSLERGLIFVSGDIHIGCIFNLKVGRSRGITSLTSSGISQIDSTQPLVGVFIDEDFSVAPGIRSVLREVTNKYNFGVVQAQPTGRGAVVSAALEYDGSSTVFGIDTQGIL
ncbi:alkaline phosphatase D family protein [Sphingomonas sp. BIUV-7]|uniref:Alkaline phosphatase D family protein n=1 Tax=Sphingomonas natans TaxID=3063330 RepID=A0ABT8Y8F8_9SPHN|nr:alkaline phosphatase D family protein [Sphingomonas sp. BIUV-7]MDO6414605.1 alkaline phosphatase D family protein [Sphingomonas sp. BIUV-7]